MQGKAEHLRIWWLTAFLLLLSFAPARIYWDAWREGVGFAGMPLFAKTRIDSTLPEIRALALPTETQFGYDGQFYAQLAIDPTLRRDEFDQALDLPAYRSLRIAMPACAWLLGVCDPLRSINVYACLNAFAWIGMLVILFRRLAPLNLRRAAVIAALLLSQGTLTSISRSLTDLPATTFLLAALLAHGPWGRGAWFFTAVITRETALISFPGFLKFRPIHEALNWRNWLPLVPAIGIFVLWYLYVHTRFPGHTLSGGENFTLPFTGLFQKISGAFLAFCSVPSRHHFFELIAPLSLTFQGGYFIVFRRPDCQVWRFAIPWAALLLCLGPWVWVEQLAFTRVLLPLTVAFNLSLVLQSHSRTEWLFCFIAGNIGLGLLAFNIYF